MCFRAKCMGPFNCDRTSITFINVYFYIFLYNIFVRFFLYLKIPPTGPSTLFLHLLVFEFHLKCKEQKELSLISQGYNYKWIKSTCLIALDNCCAVPLLTIFLYQHTSLYFVPYILY